MKKSISVKILPVKRRSIKTHGPSNSPYFSSGHGLKSESIGAFCRWVILSLTWFLAAGRKWGSEAIGRCAPYFHLVAWSVPAAQWAAGLLLAGVDGDSLAGVCHVGVQQTHLMRWLVLAPLAFHLLLGGGFLLAGLAGWQYFFRLFTALTEWIVSSEYYFK